MSELERIQRDAKELTSLGLKSSAAVIQRLRTAITEAHSAGFSHRAIHNSLNAGGLGTTWTNYRIALGRARKAEAPAVASTLNPEKSFTPAKSLRQDLLAPEGAMEAEKMQTTGSYPVTHVMEALRQAQAVASSKDYGQIARDRYRQQQRDERERRLNQKEGLS